MTRTDIINQTGGEYVDKETRRDIIKALQETIYIIKNSEELEEVELEITRKPNYKKIENEEMRLMQREQPHRFSIQLHLNGGGY